MGILKNIFTGQFIDIVQWEEETPGVLVHRFERHNNEIKNNAKLIVRPGQRAIFVNEGQVADQFGPGTYELSTKNMPILTTLLSLPYGFQSWHKAEVYFVKTTEQLDRKWGTKQPIMMRDLDLGMLRIRAFGNYSYKVGTTENLLERFIGAKSEYRAEEMEGQFDMKVVSEFSDALGELRIPALDLVAKYNEIGEHVRQKLNVTFNSMGFELITFTIGNINLPDSVNDAIDKRSELGVFNGAMGLYAQKQAADAMRDAANNPGNGGAMMGMMMGANFAGMVNQGVNQAQMTPPPPPPAGPTYFLAVNGQRQGPYDAQTLQQMAMQGTFTAATMVWTAGMAGWQAANTVPALATLFAAVPPPLP